MLIIKIILMINYLDYNKLLHRCLIKQNLINLKMKLMRNVKKSIKDYKYYRKDNNKYKLIY